MFVLKCSINHIVQCRYTSPAFSVLEYINQIASGFIKNSLLALLCKLQNWTCMSLEKLLDQSKEVLWALPWSPCCSQLYCYHSSTVTSHPLLSFRPLGGCILVGKLAQKDIVFLAGTLLDTPRPIQSRSLVFEGDTSKIQQILECPETNLFEMFCYFGHLHFQYKLKSANISKCLCCILLARQ